MHSRELVPKKKGDYNVMVMGSIDHVALVIHQRHFCFTDSNDWDIFIGFSFQHSYRLYLLVLPY